MATGPPPNYYAILEVTENASTQQIRDAYKKAALKTHPDRVASDSPERPARTRRFQIVNDAYYTLSDPSRRREYDAQRRMFGGTNSSSSTTADPFGAYGDDDDSAYDAYEQQQQQQQGGGGGGWSWAWNFFSRQDQAGANGGGGGGGGGGEQARAQADNAQFGDVFEEMLREEGMAEPGTNTPTNKFWGTLGGLSGGALGFIVANVPGLVAGAVAGNRLGAVRDAKGKSVYAVFQELPQNDRSRLLSQLAAKVFSHAVGI